MASPTIGSLFTQRVVVGVGDMAVSNNPQMVLSTYALGSCVGIVAYDSVMKVGGLLHILLPDSTLSPQKAAAQPGGKASNASSSSVIFGVRACCTS